MVSAKKLSDMVVFSPEMVKAAHDAEAEYWEGLNSIEDNKLVIKELN